MSNSLFANWIRQVYQLSNDPGVGSVVAERENVVPLLGKCVAAIFILLKLSLVPKGVSTGWKESSTTTWWSLTGEWIGLLASTDPSVRKLWSWWCDWCCPVEVPRIVITPSQEALERRLKNWGTTNINTPSTIVEVNIKSNAPRENTKCYARLGEIYYKTVDIFKPEVELHEIQPVIDWCKAKEIKVEDLSKRGKISLALWGEVGQGKSFLLNHFGMNTENPITHKLVVHSSDQTQTDGVTRTPQILESNSKTNDENKKTKNPNNNNTKTYVPSPSLGMSIKSEQDIKEWSKRLEEAKTDGKKPNPSLTIRVPSRFLEKQNLRHIIDFPGYINDTEADDRSTFEKSVDVLLCFVPIKGRGTPANYFDHLIDSGLLDFEEIDSFPSICLVITHVSEYIDNLRDEGANASLSEICRNFRVSFLVGALHVTSSINFFF